MSSVSSPAPVENKSPAPVENKSPETAKDKQLLSSYFKNFDNAGIIIFWILGFASLLLIILLISMLAGIGSN